MADRTSLSLRIMDKRQDFGLMRKKLKKTIPRNLEVPEISGGMKGFPKISYDSQPEGTPVEVDLRCRAGNDDNPNKNSFMKTTAQCHAPGVDDADFANFNVNDMKNWGKAVPLFDEDDPAEGAEDFDGIVYSRLARINKMQNTTTQNAEGKLHKTHQFFSIRNLSSKGLLKLFFRLILIGIFCSIVFSIFHRLL